MSNKLLSVGVGIASGIEKATQNIINISEAKYKMKQNEELLNLKKKAIEADSELIPFKKDQILSDISKNKTQIAYYSKLSDIKKEEWDQKLGALNKEWDMFNETISQFKQPDGSIVLPEGTTINAKNRSVSRTGMKAPSIQQQILERMSRGEETEEDKQIYNEVIKKQPRGSQVGSLFAEEEGPGAAGKPAIPPAQKEFNSPSEADSSGLPAGTIVLVGGKRYQI